MSEFSIDMRILLSYLFRQTAISEFADNLRLKGKA